MSFQLFKPTYTDRKTGERRQSESYYVRFRDHNHTRQRWPLYGDEKASRAAASRIIELVRCRQYGETAEPMLMKWVEGAPEDLRRRLVEAEIIDADHAAKGEPLSVHLEGKKDDAGIITLPGWRQHLTAGRPDREEYAALLSGRVKRVLDGCGFVYFKDLCRAGAVTKVATFLGDLRAKKEISGQTFRYYVREVKAFCRWLVDTKRATSNPMAALKGVSDPEADKQESRPLTAEEMRWVLATTAKAGAWKGYDAADRVLLYRFAYETGIRPGQIRQLSASSFDLDATPPTVTAKAATVKRRKPHTQALRPGMAQELRKALANKLPDALAFTMPDKFTCAEMFRSDLAAAREAWVNAAPEGEERLKRLRSDFLSAKDHQGRRVIFYSLRHSHGTALGNAGVPQKDIQASLHHTRSATTDRYVHADIDAKAKAVNALPDVAPVPLVLPKTGTAGDADAVCLSGACPTTFPAMQSSAQNGDAGARKNPAPMQETGFISEGDGARTRNHRIDSPGVLPGNPEKSADSSLRLSAACAAEPSDPDSAALLELLPKLSPKQRRQLLSLARSMVE